MNRKKISEGYKSINVVIKTYRKNIGQLFWDAYKQTWPELQDIEYNQADDRVIKACFEIIRNQALPTPKESVNIEFEVQNISRVCLAQLTRGRIGWWYVVESQMPSPVNHGVTMPLNFVGSKAEEKIRKLIKHSQQVYDELIEAGYPPQDCRYLLMHGQQCNAFVSTNYSALSSFFIMRTENALTDELNLVARQIKAELKKLIINDEDIDNLSKSLWLEMLNNLDCLGAKQQKCLVYDDVLGNFGRYPAGHDRVPSKDGKIKPRYDFTKSAWYKELINLYKEKPHLLFKDEDKMIEKWIKDK